MSPADRRLAALAAVLAPAAARRLLDRLVGGATAAEAAGRLSAESRAVRLAALAESLREEGRPPRRERLCAAISAERPGVAAALGALAPVGAPEPARPGRLAVAPLLARLCLERLESLLRLA